MGDCLGPTISAADAGGNPTSRVASSQAMRTRLYRRSTDFDRTYTAVLKGGAMFNRASLHGPIWQLAPVGAAVAETIDRGFDWGSAAVGAGVGAASSLLLIALGAAVHGRRTGPHHRGRGSS